MLRKTTYRLYCGIAVVLAVLGSWIFFNHVSELNASRYHLPDRDHSWSKQDGGLLQSVAMLNHTQVGQGDNYDVIPVNKSREFSGVEFPPFVEHGKPGDPGEMGNASRLNTTGFTDENYLAKGKARALYGFDDFVSRLVAVHRSLPDDLPSFCKERSYPALPPVSVLIVFYNEAWTTLLRSIHSVIDRSPPQLLEEIILLDDFSDLDHLKEPLEAYVQPLLKVKLYRAKKRLGLISARNAAFDLSRGKFVVFLDSHIECFPGWLEPLLSPIVKDLGTVTFPMVDSIDTNTFQIKKRKDIVVGGLNFRYLTFEWLFDRNISLNASNTEVISPTMPGGLFAISRDFFTLLGKYDPGLVLWGGENIEISFKTWMCGGSIVHATCSHVGHVFRKKNPYIQTYSEVISNHFRVAEVWLDKYKHYFYEFWGYNITNYGDVSDRVRLRKMLRCENFDWYLNNVYPELRQAWNTSVVYLGQIKNLATNSCVVSSSNDPVLLQPCVELSIKQQWTMTHDGLLRSENYMLGLMDYRKLDKAKNKPFVYTDNNKSFLPYCRWTYRGNKLVNTDSGLCLEADLQAKVAILRTCQPESQVQDWELITRFQRRERLRKGGHVPIDWSV